MSGIVKGERRDRVSGTVKSATAGYKKAGKRGNYSHSNRDTDFECYGWL